MISPRLVSKLPAPESWITDAPCATDDVTAHDLPATYRGTNKLRAHALIDQRVMQALDNCARCPYRAECLERVAPSASYYDGVCGGYVWLNGAVIGGLTSEIAS